MNRCTSCSRYGALTWEERPRYCLDMILNGPRAISGLVVKSKTSSYLSEGRSSRSPAIFSRAQQLELSVWPQTGHSFSIRCEVTVGGAPRVGHAVSESICKTCRQWPWTLWLLPRYWTTPSPFHPTPPPGLHHSSNITTRFVCGPVIPTQLNPPAPNLCRPCDL